MTKEREMIGLDEAIEHVMRVTGKTRRQALKAIVEKVATGELPAWGTLKNTQTGEIRRHVSLPKGDIRELETGELYIKPTSSH